jgi:hypothetical protein
MRNYLTNPARMPENSARKNKIKEDKKNGIQNSE